MKNSVVVKLVNSKKLLIITSFLFFAILQSQHVNAFHSGDVKLNVPFVGNAGGTCASSSFTMVLQYYGLSVTLDEVLAVVGLPPFPDSLFQPFTDWIGTEFGLKMDYRPESLLADVKKFINQGYPVIVHQQFLRNEATGHNRVVIGYNDSTQEVILNDPSSLGPNYRMTYNDFEYLWKAIADIEPVPEGELYLITPYIPVPDIKANGSDGPLFVTPSESVDISISLDPGDIAGELADWWIGIMSPYGTFPIIARPLPLFELAETSLFEIPLPVGLWVFYFILDDNPNGIFDRLTWYDYVVVAVSSEGLEFQTEALPDFEAFFQEKIRRLMKE